jgi:hypothetical protein
LYSTGIGLWRCSNRIKSTFPIHYFFTPSAVINDVRNSSGNDPIHQADSLVLYRWSRHCLCGSGALDYETATLEVYTNLGQVVALAGSGAISNNGIHRISLKGLAPGAYVLKISHKGQAQTVKLFYQP